jgi:hypothetical protein
MPRLNPSRVRSLDQQVVTAETGFAAPIGPAVIDLLSLAYRANVPAMLIGSHGLGKSEITAEAAAALGIDFVSRDLSLMEPPDLCGLPRVVDGATQFVPPDFLPRETGRGGLLLIEEINRAPRYMQACCLELLTSRRLNSYRLPDGWTPMAAINPKSPEGGYHVDLLDAALMSRFMRIDVRASEESWLAWARRSGIHPKVIEYVSSVPNSLDEGQGGSNPRSWAYASRTLLAAGEEFLEKSPDAVITALVGLVGPIHTTALMRLIMGTEVALKPTDVLHSWPSSRAMLRRWMAQGRLDLISASMRTMLSWVRPDGTAEELRRSPEQAALVKRFFQALQGDLREQARACLLELGHTFLLPDTDLAPTPTVASADGAGGGGPAACLSTVGLPTGSGQASALPRMTVATRRQLRLRNAATPASGNTNGRPK